MSFSSFLKSAETDVTSLFTKVSADVSKATSMLSSVDLFLMKVMGEAEVAAGVLAAVDPAIGAPILAEVATVESAYAAFKALAPTIASDASKVLSEGMTLMSDAVDLSVKLGPFVTEVANDTATAVAAFKAIPALATATPATA